MRNKTEIGFKLSNWLILLVSTLALIISSCYNKPSRTERGKIIHEKEFIAILRESYIADGLLSQPEIKGLFVNRDSNLAYIDIVEKHGYTKNEMDNTLKYYFTKNPKKLLKIYDKIIGQLSEAELYYAGIAEKAVPRRGNKWNLKTSWEIPDTAGTEKPGFEFKLDPPGFYIMTFTITIYPDDISANPCFTAFYYKSDSTADNKPTWLRSIKYLKDGMPHDYLINGRIEGDSAVILKGWFCDFENNPELSGQHLQIENVAFSFDREER